MHSEPSTAQQNDSGDTAQLLHALAQSQTLIDALHQYSAVTVADASGQITYANALFLQASGYTLSELLGQSHHIVSSGVHSAEFWQHMWCTIQAGDTWRGVICNRAKDASLVWFDTQISPILNPKGCIEQYVSLRTDITALMRANEAAQKATLAKSQFLANMSHEIRTPMNAVLGMLALLDGTPLTARQMDYRSKAESAARSLLGIINQVLDLSKIDAGKMSLDCQPFSLSRLMHQVLDLMQANLGGKPVQLQLVLDPALPPTLMGDALRLRQVLVNLGGNAVKFTAHGQIVLQARLLSQSAAGVSVRLSVQDSGIGIAPENQQCIFGSFAQAQSSTTRQFGGTGLGLTISRQLVALMGAELKLDSTLGQGSTFSFDLTLAPGGQALPPEPQPAPDPAQVKVAQPATAASSPAAAQPKPLAGLRLLVVEDNPVNQMVAHDLLSARGASVELADNGQLGVAAVAAATLPFDAVLMDIQMPVMDGYAATRAIRNDLGLATLPIIGLSANAFHSDRDASLGVGMNAHVGKPFSIEALVEILLEHIISSKKLLSSAYGESAGSYD